MTRLVLQPCPYCDVISNSESVYDGLGGRIYLCDHCGKPVSQLRVGEKEEIYPKGIPKRLSDVPEKIEGDHVESRLCYGVGAWKATVVMCRRALQAVCIEKGATGDTLIQQIENLRASGLIAKDLADWAREIRIEGNVGAHPDKDGLQDVSKEDAEAVLTFLEEFLKYVYIMPAQIAKRRASK